MTRSFNLLDQPWVPVADVGRVSLRQLFAEPAYAQLGGNPVQKIALMKLLLSIAQAAYTPKDQDDWLALGSDGLAQKCLAYLDQWSDRFDLYGEKPFLQIPAIAAAKVQSYGAVLADIAAGNTTVLTQSQVGQPLDDADKALLLVTLMGFALSGKKTDNSVILTNGYAGKTNDKGKPASGSAGPAVAHMGLLHSVLQGLSVQQTIWLNLFTQEQITQRNAYFQGLGVAPWEEMPAGEDCLVAQRLKNSLQGRLVPMCRFCLLTDTGLHYSEGIAHAGYKEGAIDPSVAINHSGKEPKALWCNPDKRPWRELTSLLGFIEQSGSQGFQSWQVSANLDRIRDVGNTSKFGLWSGGLSVSSNAGEQYVSGQNDYVESVVWLDSNELGEIWLTNLKQEMKAIEESLANNLYGRVSGFYKAQKVDGKGLAAQATAQFWQMVERDFQSLVDHCDNDEASIQQRRRLRLRFAGYTQNVYDQFCPKDSARQLDAWAKNRPNTFKYLKEEA